MQILHSHLSGPDGGFLNIEKLGLEPLIVAENGFVLDITSRRPLQDLGHQCPVPEQGGAHYMAQKHISGLVDQGCALPGLGIVLMLVRMMQAHQTVEGVLYFTGRGVD